MSNTITYTIELKYQIKGYNHLQFGAKKLFNVKTGRVKKQCYNNGMIGYWLDSKTFKSIKWVKNNLESIEIDTCPF